VGNDIDGVKRNQDFHYLKQSHDISLGLSFIILDYALLHQGYMSEAGHYVKLRPPSTFKICPVMKGFSARANTALAM